MLQSATAPPPIAPPPTIGELLSIIAADTAEATAPLRSAMVRGPIAAAGLSFGAVLAIAAVVAVRVCARRPKAPRAGSRRRGYEAASKDAGGDEDDDDEPVSLDRNSTSRTKARRLPRSSAL